MNTVQCPVCTLYLREGISLKEHLDTHPKDKVIEALVSNSEEKAAAAPPSQFNFQPSFIQSPYQVNHVQNPMQFSILPANQEQIQTAPTVFVPHVIANRRYLVSQPGTIIKIPQRPPNTKLFTTVPPSFCNQIIGVPPTQSQQVQYAPQQIPMATRATQPTLIYSQMPQSVPVSNVQQHPSQSYVHPYQGGTIMAPQTSMVVSQSSSVVPSISNSLTSNTSFCNSSVQSFTTANTVQSNQQSNQKITLVERQVPMPNEYCNTSSTAYQSKEYVESVETFQRVKQVHQEMNTTQQYQYFHEAEVNEESEARNSENYDCAEDNEMKQENEEYIEDKASEEDQFGFVKEPEEERFDSTEEVSEPLCYEDELSNCTMTNTETNEDCDYESKYDDEMDFEGSKCGDEMTFEDSKCDEEITFESSKCDDEMTFEDSKCGDEMTFEDSKCGDEMTFEDSKCSEEMAFKEPKLGEVSSSENSKCGNQINLDSSNCGNETNSDDSQYEKETNSDNSKCGNGTNFDNSKVGNESNLDNSKCGNEINSENFKCGNEINSGESKCGNEIDLEVSKCDDEVNSEKSNFKSECKDSKCEGKMNFKQWKHRTTTSFEKSATSCDLSSSEDTKEELISIIEIEEHDVCKNENQEIALSKLKLTSKNNLEQAINVDRPYLQISPRKKSFLQGDVVIEETHFKNYITPHVTIEPRVAASRSSDNVTIDSPSKNTKKRVCHKVVEEPRAKKLKSSAKESSSKNIIDMKPRGLPVSLSAEELIPCEIKQILYSFSAFGNSVLEVHQLDIPKIKSEVKEEDVSKRFQPSTSGNPSTLPIVNSQALSEVKIEPATNKTLFDQKTPKLEQVETPLPTSIIFRDRSRKPKVLKIKNAKSNIEQQNSSSACAQSSLSSVNTVIQHSVKTEPPPSYDAKHGNNYSTFYCEPSSSKSEPKFYGSETAKNGQRHSSFPGVHLSSHSPASKNNSESVEVSTVGNSLVPQQLHSPSLQDYTDLIANTKLDRLANIHQVDYDSVDTPQWLFRGINILPTVIEDDRVSCASPKTLLNLDHQTSFQTFEPEDSGSTSINMQTDEMMPPRGELSGQESLESSVWGYQEDNAPPQYKEWAAREQELDIVSDSNSNTFRTKIEKIEPSNSNTFRTKIEKVEPIESVKLEPVHPLPHLDVAKKKHACIYCNKTFTGWKLRKYHMKTEHPELFNEPETGKLLDKVKTPSSTVISEPSTSFIDPITIKFENTYLYGRNLQEPNTSIASSTKPKFHQCVSCLELFNKLKAYQEHIRYVHPLVCPVCNKTFFTKPNLTIHMRTHLKIKPYKCDVCEKSFVTAQKLSDHKNTHTGNTPFPCNLCERNFKRYSNLAQHKKVIHLKKKKTKDFYCHCGEIFQSKGKLLWHQETHAVAPKQCSFCVEKFTHTSSLTRHIRKNHDPCYLPEDRKKTDENVTCEVCKIVVLKSTLKSHMRIHNSSKPFSCTVCKKSFYTKWNLGLHQWTHVSRTHMPHKCKSCNRGFYSASEYQAHLRSHRNIRPYTCNYCGRKFIRKFNCIRHVREHEAKKKYSCTVCGKTFHRSYYLTAHVRVHNGERPFSCHICGKTSTTKSNHNKHVKTHHARETINTEG